MPHAPHWNSVIDVLKPGDKIEINIYRRHASCQPYETVRDAEFVKTGPIMMQYKESTGAVRKIARRSIYRITYADGRPIVIPPCSHAEIEQKRRIALSASLEKALERCRKRTRG